MKSKVYAYKHTLETASADAKKKKKKKKKKKNSEEIKKLKGCSKVIRNEEIYYDDYDRILHSTNKLNKKTMANSFSKS